MSNADVNLAAFENGGLFATEGLGQFHVHIGKTFGISRQKRRQDTFDRVRRGGNFQHPSVSALEHFHPLPDWTEKDIKRQKERERDFVPAKQCSAI